MWQMTEYTKTLSLFCPVYGILSFGTAHGLSPNPEINRKIRVNCSDDIYIYNININIGDQVEK